MVLGKKTKKVAIKHLKYTVFIGSTLILPKING